ncbi:hypothetical protein RHSIM_Rhsim08G0151500 [Rhododendron simsii]|uniref:Uncharacterized protein n=1 Tax=Rhododendron simsii TaxID=118357 RepID=A0A834LH55_RHOSS|nr:hypothetical protein RHSIM_Rhsim08G0151500 [Rhododendron simsii]
MYVSLGFFGNTKGTDKRKNNAGHDNIDGDYLSSNGEGKVSSSEDGDSLDDDESSGSQANKVRGTGAGPGKKKGDYKNNMVVRRVFDIKCQSLYADWKCDLYKHYKDLKEKKVSDIKRSAFYPCNPNDWVFMIENEWETEDWKPLAEHFKETHIRHRYGKYVWINDKAKEAHVNPQTQEQAFIKVLGKRSGYLKGYEIRKTTKANARPSQPIPNPKVVALQQKVANHEKAMADQAKMFQNMMMMMVVMKSRVDPTCIPGLVSCSGNEEDGTFVGEEDDEAFF